MTYSRRSLALAAIVAMALAACGGEGTRDATAADAGNTADDNDTPPVPVEVGLPVRGDVFAVYQGTAPIEAYADADVIAKVAGEVEAILVEEGDVVVKGQELAVLDGDRLRLTVNESAARLRKLQREVERNIELSEKGLISAGDFEKIRFEMEALQAAHNLASLELDYTRIRAPIDGVVSARYIKQGSMLAVNDPVFRVTSLDPLVAYVHVPEREFRNIAPGQRVNLAVDALQADPVVSSVTRVSPVVDPLTGTFKVTIEIYDKARRIKPGMFARVGIVHEEHENALLVPRSAIVEEAGQSSVFVVDNGIALRKPVSTGFVSDGRVEILSGLVGGEQVVMVGQAGLRPESRVQVINTSGEVRLAGAPGSKSDEVSRDAPAD